MLALWIGSWVGIPSHSAHTPPYPTIPVAGSEGQVRATPFPGLPDPDPGLGGKVCGPLGPTLAKSVMLADCMLFMQLAE